MFISPKYSCVVSFQALVESLKLFGMRFSRLQHDTLYFNKLANDVTVFGQ